MIGRLFQSIKTAVKICFLCRHFVFYVGRGIHYLFLAVNLQFDGESYFFCHFSGEKYGFSVSNEYICSEQSISLSMGTLKNFLLIMLFATVIVSFVWMIFGLFIKLTIEGFFASIVFGLSSVILYCVLIPYDEDKGLIDHGRNDG